MNSISCGLNRNDLWTPAEVEYTYERWTPDRASIRRLIQWMDVAAFLALACAALFIGPHRMPWFVGLVLAFVSFPLWILARLQLGAAFSLRPEARRLVTDGLYSRIRHPIYLFGTLAFFGVLLALQIWPVLIIWLALTPIEVIRIRREERVLKETFGEQYTQYRSRTWL